MPYAYINIILNMPLEQYLKSNIDEKTNTSEITQILSRYLTSLVSLKSEPIQVTDIQREIIWNNKYIRISSKTVFNKQLFENSLIYINDLISESGKFISYKTLVDSYGPFITPYNYTCLKDAIPKKWRHTLIHNNLLNLNPHNETVY